MRILCNIQWLVQSVSYLAIGLVFPIFCPYIPNIHPDTSHLILTSHPSSQLRFQRPKFPPPHPNIPPSDQIQIQLRLQLKRGHEVLCSSLFVSEIVDANVEMEMELENRRWHSNRTGRKERP